MFSEMGNVTEHKQVQKHEQEEFLHAFVEQDYQVVV